MQPHHTTGEPEPTREAVTLRFQNCLIISLLLLCVLWTVKIVEQTNGVSFSDWGLFPRTSRGLLGVLTMPFLHKDIDHLYHNSFGVFVLSLGLYYFFPKVATRVLVISTLAGGFMVWCFARPAYHIGASGLVYSLSSFLFVSGCLRYDRPSKGAALIVAMLYGGAVWGIFPIQRGVSWEGHLFGAIAGVYLAILYRDVDLPPRDEIVAEEEEEPYEGVPYWLQTNEGEHDER